MSNNLEIKLKRADKVYHVGVRKFTVYFYEYIIFPIIFKGKCFWSDNFNFKF